MSALVAARLYAIIAGPQLAGPRSPPWAPQRAAAGSAAGLARHLRRREQPLIEPGLFRSRASSGAVAIASCGLAAADVAVSMTLPTDDHKLQAFGMAVLAACCPAAAFAVMAYLLDDGDLRALLARLRQAARLRP